jgi:hypothetical protein
MRDLGFNIGHWMFAYEYYMSAISMEYIFMQKEMPRNRKDRLELMNKILYALNIGVIVAYYFTLLTGNIVATKTDNETNLLEITHPWWFWTYLTTRYSTGILQLVSGVFLLAAVFLIRHFLVEQGLKDQCNHKAMIIHSVSFSLYNLAIIIYYVFFFVFELRTAYGTQSQIDTAWVNCLIAWCVTTWTNFFAQLCLIWIFMQFRPKEEKEAIDNSAYDDVRCSVVRLQEFDEPIAQNRSKANTDSLVGDEPELQNQYSFDD